MYKFAEKLNIYNLTITEMEEMTKNTNIKEPRWIKGQTALARELGVTQQTISLWQNNGKFRDCYARIGKKYIYNLDAIMDKFAG